jgi:hypothetical protein
MNHSPAMNAVRLAGLKSSPSCVAGSKTASSSVPSRDTTKGDTEVGHQGGVCAVTSVQRAEAQCLATYSLPGGQITGQALIRLGDPAPYAVAITGGSGCYKDVEGEIRVDPASETQPRGSPDLPPAGLIGPATRQLLSRNAG